MMPAADGVCWASPGAAGFLWREFGSVSVLFDPRSGETHLLDPLAREILDLLIEQPRTGSQATAALQELIGGSDEDLRPRVDEAMAEFDRLGLISPATVR